MAYSVSRCTRAVGTRTALGAQRSDVLMLLLKSAALLVALGFISELIASWFATRGTTQLQFCPFVVRSRSPA